ncbi:hypothetical protein ACFLUZ_02960 [Chloroflexota bacterium]
MEAISFIILILLSLLGYCAGAVGKAGKSVQLKPKILDLIVISAIWGGAIFSRIALDLNKWLIILVWIAIGIVIGILVTWPRKLPEEQILSNQKSEESANNFLKNLWQRWGNFSKRMSNFQSRILLSLFFFIAVSPFALGVKIFSDPLRLKYQSDDSHWLHRIKTAVDLEQSRRQ